MNWIAQRLGRLVRGAMMEQPISEVAREIANQFTTGTITDSDLSPHSISELEIAYLGKQVRVTWYPAFIGPRRLRTLSIDCSEGVFPQSADSRHIFNAAIQRADALIDEKMAELDTLRRKSPATSRQPGSGG